MNKKKLNIREIATKANVSPSTVSLVLNNKEGVGKKKRHIISELLIENGYTVLSDTDINKSTNKVLFVKYTKTGKLVEENQGFVSAIIDAIQLECNKLDLSFTLLLSTGNLSATLSEIDYSSYFGVIVLGTELIEEDYSLLELIKCPFVVVDNYVKGYDYNTVSINNFEEVGKILRFCKQKKYNKIAYFHSSLWTCNFEEREKSFYSNVSELGLEHNKKTDLFLLKPTMLGAYESMKEILERKSQLNFDCAFADNDSIALGAIKALKEFGYKIPKDLSVVGFDNIPFSSVSSPTITTIQVPKSLLGIMAIDQLNRSSSYEEEKHVKIVVSGYIIERESTK